MKFYYYKQVGPLYSQKEFLFEVDAESATEADNKVKEMGYNPLSLLFTLTKVDYASLAR